MSDFNYFGNNWIEQLVTRVGPWYVIPINQYLWDFAYRSPGITLIAAEMALWMIENSPNEQPFVQSKDNKRHFFYFTNKNIAQKFSEWWNESDFKTKKIESESDKGKIHLLWPDKIEFDQQLEIDGKIQVASHFKRHINFYNPGKDNFRITQESFDIFVWTRQNLKHKIWNWDHTFYFENEQDAMAFKLKWAKE